MNYSMEKIGPLIRKYRKKNKRDPIWLTKRQRKHLLKAPKEFGDDDVDLGLKEEEFEFYDIK